MSVMRLSLWTGLLQSVVYNQNRQQSRVAYLKQVYVLFLMKVLKMVYVRQAMIAGVITGQQSEEHWDMEKAATDFYDIKV